MGAVWQVLQGGPSDRQAAGIWSCGVLLHYMLTEELPDLEALKTGAQRGALPLHLKGVSAECRDLLGGMLRVDPAERADAWWIMNHPWFQMDCPEVTTLPTNLVVNCSWPAFMCSHTLQCLYMRTSCRAPEIYCLTCGPMHDQLASSCQGICAALMRQMGYSTGV